MEELKKYQIVYIAILLLIIGRLSTFDSLSLGTKTFVADDEQTFFLILAGTTLVGIIFFEFVVNTTRFHYLVFHISSIIGLVVTQSFGSALAIGFVSVVTSLSFHFFLVKFLDWKEKKQIVH